MRTAKNIGASAAAASTFTRTALCVVLALPALALAQPAHGGGPAAGAAGMGGKDMMAVMKDSQEHMKSTPMTGKPDIDFAMMMRMHHLSGIQMAEIELRDGKDPKTRDMAKKIIASQKKEVRQFEAFLAKHGHPVEKAK